MEKQHQLILLSADLRKVYARLARRFNADIAQMEERHIRNVEVESSMLSVGPKVDER